MPYDPMRQPMPPRYGYAGGAPGDRISELLARQGQIAAEGAQRSADIWGNTLGNIGQQVGGAITQRAEEKQAEKERQRLNAQDTAFSERLNSGQPLMPKDFVSIYGPDRGMKMAVAYSQLQSDKPDPKAIMAGLDAMTDPMRAQAWTPVRQKMIQAHGLPEEMIPSEYDSQWYSQFSKQMRGPTKLQGADPGQSFFDPDKPEAGAVFTAPAEAAKAPEPRVVGRSLVGPDGKVIYRDPESPRAQGDGEPLVAVMGPNGEPVLVPRSQAAGQRPASTREQGRPVTSGDAGRLADLDTSLDDINALGRALGVTGTGSKIGASLPNVITDLTGLGADSKARQATIDRVKQVIGKALEEGVLRKEDEYKYEKILPTIGDPPTVAAAKLEGLWNAIQLRRRTTLDSLADAGYDTGRYAARPERTRERSPEQGRASAAKSGDRRMINGQLAEWDGHGWAAVE